MEPAFLRELFEAVGEVEALVVRFATLRMSEVERQNLTVIVENGEHEEADYSLVNDRFHDALRQDAQNPMLSGLLDDLQLRTMPLRRAQFRAQSDRIHSSQAEHCAILRAVFAHDADEAETDARPYRRFAAHGA